MSDFFMERVPNPLCVTELRRTSEQGMLAAQLCRVRNYREVERESEWRQAATVPSWDAPPDLKSRFGNRGQPRSVSH